MTTKQKLNVLLAITDHLASVYKKGLEDYVKFFKSSQGAFKGIKKTYEPRLNTVDQPNERQSTMIVTTVDEKLNDLQMTSREYIDALFSQEKTNSSGVAKAQLIVDGVKFGEYTSMELLRLKSILESGTLKDMFENIPVRSDDEIWNKSSNEIYVNRNVYEAPLLSNVKKSVLKESYILQDPNIDKIQGAGKQYTPQIATKDTVVELGDYTVQKFSGEYSHLQRANVLARRSIMLTGVIEALKTANDVEAIPSEMTADKIFNYLLKGKEVFTRN